MGFNLKALMDTTHCRLSSLRFHLCAQLTKIICGERDRAMLFSWWRWEQGEGVEIDCKENPLVVGGVSRACCVGWLLEAVLGMAAISMEEDVLGGKLEWNEGSSHHRDCVIERLLPYAWIH